MSDNWDNIKRHYEKLLKEIYDEGPSPHHERGSKEVVKDLCSGLDFDSVVELGCGYAPMLDEMKAIGKKTFGVTIGEEKPKHDYIRADMHFTNLPNDSYDMVVVRHALEHSPMPLLLLMEMRRIARKYALVIVPVPNIRTVIWPNHYSVFNELMWGKLFSVSGWNILRRQKADFLVNEYNYFDKEYRWLLKAA